MARIFQVTYRWTGFPGATGFTNFYFQATAGDSFEALAVATQSRVFFSGIASILPSNVNIDCQTDVRLIEDSNGDLTNIFTVSGLTQVKGTGGPAGYAGASGGCVDWLTGAIHGKHLMVGRTFVVPLVGGAYENNGTLTPGTVTTLATAAETFRTQAGPLFGVWGRPRAAKVPPDPNKPQIVGAWHPAISSRIPDKAVVLRSRRD
jgi:hypothetical protein